MQMPSESLECGAAAGQSEHDKVPCKTVGLQCLAAAMGCPAMTMVKPDVVPGRRVAIETVKSLPALADVLHGRSCAPELEPPTLLT